MKMLIAALGLAVAFPALALPQEQAPPKAACAAIDTALPDAYRAWTNKLPQLAAAKPADVPLAVLTPGKAVVTQLIQSSEVKFAFEPDQPPPPTSRSGLFSLRISQAGRYAFALDVGAWVDLGLDGKSQRSVDHGHQPPCSSIRKEVEFDLTPGSYVLQLTGSPKAEVALLVTRLK